MSVLKNSAMHMVAIVGVFCTLYPGIEPVTATSVVSDGAWLQLCSDKA